MSVRFGRMTRRAMGKLLVALPAATLVRQKQAAEQPSDLATCLAARESAFSADEKARLEKAITGLEKSLKAIREFKLPPSTEPSLRFSARRSRGN